jgi:hypothetical protein
MKHMKKAFALSGLLVLMTFASALGQSDRQTIIHIPFNFSVGEKAFPAGKYVIERNRKDSDTVWVIKRNDSAGKAMILTRPVQTMSSKRHDWSSISMAIFIFWQSSGRRAAKPGVRFKSPIARRRWIRH